MHREFILIDKSPKLDKIVEIYKKIVNNNFDCLSIPSSLLEAIKTFDNKYIAAQIDYPFGLACTKAKIKEAQYCSSFGVSYIDVVANHYLIENLLETKFCTEIESIQKSLKGGELRLIIDYRLFDSLRLNFFGNLCAKNSINTVILGTGTMLEDPIDNLIVAKMLENKYGLHTISTGVIRTEEDFEKFKEQKLFGIRISSVSKIDIL